MKLAVIAYALSALSVAGGCRGDIGNGAFEPSAIGRVGVELAIVTPNDGPEIRYVLTGPHGFYQEGVLPTAMSGVVRMRVVLPLGAGYMVSLETTVDEAVQCTGSARFDVVTGHATAVRVQMRCPSDAAYGSVLVDGTLNRCPRIDTVVATPSSTEPVDFVLQGVASDDDVPFPLRYRWTVGGGRLGAPLMSSTSFTCTAPGPVALTLDVTDGDYGCRTARASLDLVCPELPPGGGNGGNGGIVAVGGSGGSVDTGGGSAIADGGLVVGGGGTMGDPAQPDSGMTAALDAGPDVTDEDAGHL